MRWILAMVMVVTTACGTMASDFRWGNQPAAWTKPAATKSKGSEPGVGTGVAIGVAAGVALTVIAAVVWANSVPEPEPLFPEPPGTCCGH